VPRIRTTVSLSIQDNHFTDFVDNGVDFSGNQLPGIPTNNLLVLGDIYLTKSVYLNYSFTHHGSQYLDDSNQASYEGYQLHHAKLGINLNRTLRMRTKIYFGIKNVFNSKYASMILINAPSFSGSLPRYYYPGLPRYFYSGIGLNF
jgi:iron complex outermembrane receptor protein